MSPPYEFRVRPWAELHALYQDMASRSPQFDYLLRIVESIEASSVKASLAGMTSMHDLLVSDLPMALPLEPIVVRAPSSLHPPDDGCVRIEHLSHSGRNDSIQRHAMEAVPLFWRFVSEKLGVDPSP